ncbi:MAG: putative molybdenum carrier protein [Bacteroidetes bacterium]|nr:putative molybdenum carrier protein [Bacteroidota bacterium]MCY4204773.1 putative molybdenum carrier protein [Bacteroidota bacterium]
MFESCQAQLKQKISSIRLTVISGGQTGVDRAALDAAIKWGVSYQGWCPAGRLAEDGRIPDCYLLRDTPTIDAAERTVRNVQDSEGILILGEMNRSKGTRLARKTAISLNRSIYQSEFLENIEPVLQWLRTLNRGMVNIAGPRESEQPGIYAGSFKFLDQLLNHLTTDNSTS